MLTVHFLNVGHGDCTFVEFPSGRVAMIDVNNSKSLPSEDKEALAELHGQRWSEFAFVRVSEAGNRSWEEYYRSLLVDPYDYYVANFSGRTIFRYVQTHPDMDHMSGLARFFWDEKVPLGCFWDTRNSKALEAADFSTASFQEAGYAYRDWAAYQELRAGRRHDGSAITVIDNLQNAVGTYWTNDSVDVMGPTQDLVDYSDATENWNNCSYVLRLKHAGRTLILPGDAEKPEWDKIEESYEASDLKCDVLKAAHHGRESGYSQSVVESMDPDFVICSVGKKPSTDASDEYTRQGARVLSTRFNGTITVRISDNGAVTIENLAGSIIGSLPPL